MKNCICWNRNFGTRSINVSQTSCLSLSSTLLPLSFSLNKLLHTSVFQVNQSKQLMAPAPPPVDRLSYYSTSKIPTIPVSVTSSITQKRKLNPTIKGDNNDLKSQISNVPLIASSTSANGKTQNEMENENHYPYYLEAYRSDNDNHRGHKNNDTHNSNNINVNIKLCSVMGFSSCFYMGALMNDFEATKSKLEEIKSDIITSDKDKVEHDTQPSQKNNKNDKHAYIDEKVLYYFMRYGKKIDPQTGKLVERATDMIINVNGKPMIVKAEDYTNILAPGSVAEHTWWTRVVSIENFSTEEECKKMISQEKEGTNEGFGADESSGLFLLWKKFSSCFKDNSKSVWVVPAEVIRFNNTNNSNSNYNDNDTTSFQNNQSSGDIQTVSAKDRFRLEYMKKLGDLVKATGLDLNTPTKQDLKMKRYLAADPSIRGGSQYHYDYSAWTYLLYLQVPQTGGETTFRYLMDSEGKVLSKKPRVGTVLVWVNCSDSYHSSLSTDLIRPKDNVEVIEVMKHCGNAFDGDTDKVILQTQIG